MRETKTSEQFYLGTDPSAQSSGLGLITVVDQVPRERRTTTIRPPKDCRGAARLHYIYNEASQFLVQAGVSQLTRVCIEGASLHSTNRETTLSQVRGIFLLLAYQTGECEPTELAPTQVKKFAAGSGSATKEEVMAAVVARGYWSPQNDDESDACAAAEVAYALDYYESTTLTRPQLELIMLLLQGKPLKSKPVTGRSLNV